MSRWVRSPILHFALLGGLLFVLRVAVRMPSADDPPRIERAPIVVSAAAVQRLASDFEQRWGRSPTRGQLQALIAQSVQDEMLYREARVLALEFRDGSVRRRLVEKMRAVSDRPGQGEDEFVREAERLGLDDDVVIRRLLIEEMRTVLQADPNPAPISDDAVRDYVERHRDEFAQPATVTFRHVFLSSALRGTHVASDAKAALAALGSEPPPSPRLAALSDAFPLGLEFRSYSQLDLQGRFGKPFAEEVFGLEPERWSGPIASPYGLHLIRVGEVTPERLSPIEVVRPTVVVALLQWRAAERLQQGLARLHDLYEVRVEDDAQNMLASAP